jgi:hypothetical protein
MRWFLDTSTMKVSLIRSKESGGWSNGVKITMSLLSSLTLSKSYGKILPRIELPMIIQKHIEPAITFSGVVRFFLFSLHIVILLPEG